MRMALVTILVSLLALLPGCGNPLPPADVTFISSSEHNYWDPQRMSWHHDIRLAHCLYDTLVTLDFEDMSIHPAVAERWEVSDDQLTYTFHLRDNAKWSNGDPVTAGDFVYAWRRALLPDLAADYTMLLFHIKGAKAFFDTRQKALEDYARIVAESGKGGSADAAHAMWTLTLNNFDETVGIQAPDDRTLVVTLERPTPFFLDLVAFATFMPVHRESVEAEERFEDATGRLTMDASYWSDPGRLITNGAYMLGVREFRQGVHIKANPHYWNKANVKNGSINELIITSEQTALQAYESGQAQLWLDVPSAKPIAADLLAQNRRDVHPQDMAGTYFYNFNCLPKLLDGRPNPLADARVRRALSMAIDREALTKQVTRLNQPPAMTFVPPGVLKDYEPPVEAGISYNVEEARRLLAEAGYPDGKGLTGLSILYNTGQGHDIPAQAIAAMWREKLGVVVTAEGVETKVFSERMKQQDYTICRASWFGDYPDPTTWLGKMHSQDGNNDNKWINLEYDTLLAKAETETDPAKRLAILRDAETILVREAPMALLFHYVSIYLIKPEITGLDPNPWHRWKLDQATVAKP